MGFIIFAMARCVSIFLLPILLSLSLLADATRYNLPLRKRENNNEKDDSVIIQDAFKHSRLLPLSSDSEIEMTMEVPQLGHPAWKTVRVPTETHNRIIESPGLIETKREKESIEGIKGLRFGRRGGCHGLHGGGKLKFRHFPMLPQGDRLRPQFRRSFVFPSSGDAHLHGEYDYKADSSVRSSPAMVMHQTENKESGFEPRETTFKRIGRSFPKRRHSHTKWEWASSNQKEDKERKHQKRQGPAATWMDWLKNLFPRL